MNTFAIRESSEMAETVPYPPSWVDRAIDWVRALPGPSWLFYLALGSILVLAEFAVKWIDGSYPVGVVDPFHAAFVGIGVYALWAMHYLDDYAEIAIATFRPALTTSDKEYEQLRYQLTTLPARPVAALTPIFLGAVAIILIFSGSETGNIYVSLKLYSSPLSYVVEGTALLIWGAAAGPFIYHAYHQLHIVNLIYTRHTAINLFHLRPLYAFSKLTARAALILIFLIYPAFLISPRVLADPVIWISCVGISLIAIWNFIGPLLGIHNFLIREKDHLLTQVSHRVEEACAKIDRHIDSGEFSYMEAMMATLETLVTRQKIIESIPTWPWSAETPRLIVTALLLPVVLYVTQLVITRLLGNP